MYALIYMCSHTHTQTPLHTSSHAHAHARTHTCAHTNIQCMHPQHTHTHSHLHTCTCTPTYTRTHMLKMHMVTYTDQPRPPSLSSLPHIMHSHTLTPMSHMCTHKGTATHMLTPMHTHSHTQGCHATIRTSQTQAAIFKIAHPLIKSSFFILHTNWPTSASLPLPTQ